MQSERDKRVYVETDLDYLPAVSTPNVTDGCVRTAQFAMYLAVAAVATTLVVILALNFSNINETILASHRIVATLDQRRDAYLAKVDNAFDRADGVVNQAITLVTDSLLPMLSNSSTDAKETLDKFLAVLKSYSQKGKLTVEVPL